MRKFTGVKFKDGGKIYDFESFALVLNIGEKVIVETDQGQGFGMVEIPPKELLETHIKKDLKQMKMISQKEKTKRSFFSKQEPIATAIVRFRLKAGMTALKRSN